MLLKVYNLWRQIAKPSQVDRSGKIKFLPYGPGGNGGNFPLMLADLVKRSPTASACISTKADYIKGEGFNNQDLESFKINSRGQTLLSFHDENGDSVAFIEGFAWNVKYGKDFKISEVYPVSFENLRLAKPDDNGFIAKILYNPFFGTTLYSEKDTCEYDTFNPDREVVKEQMITSVDKKTGETKYKGQILYYGRTSPLSRFYSEPSYVSCKDSMESDRRISEYNKENLAGGLLQSFMLIMKGNPDEPTKNPNFQEYKDDAGNIRPMTKAEEFDYYMGDAFMGTERVANMMVQWVDNTDEKPEILTFPSLVNENVINSMQQGVIKNITIATKVPAVLANIHEGVSLGGDGNMIRAAVKLMQQRAMPMQRVLVEHYKLILQNWSTPVDSDIEIVPYSPFPEIETIDPQVWQELSKEERRDWIKNHTEIELIEASKPVTETPPAPEQTPPIPAAIYKNSLHTDYPEKAMSNAKRALEWSDKMGTKCSGSYGMELAAKISAGHPISFKDLKRIYNYLRRNESYLDSPFDKGCSGVLTNLWGGKEMLKWAESRINEVLK